MADTKMCRKCLLRKPLNGFSKLARNKDGLQSYCKACAREYQQANADRIAKRKLEYRQANADLIAEYRLANAERVAEYNRKYNQANADRKAELNRKYHRANADRIAERHRAYYRANPDIRYRASAKRRATKRNAVHEPYSRSEILTRWDYRCCYCDAPAEHLDHVMPLSRGGADADWNLVPACAPCNLSKSSKTLAEWAKTF